jgi:hypothetical protein
MIMSLVASCVLPNWWWLGPNRKRSAESDTTAVSISVDLVQFVCFETPHLFQQPLADVSLALRLEHRHYRNEMVRCEQCTLWLECKCRV